MGAGLLLSYRAVQWLLEFPFSMIIALETIGLALALGSCIFGFSKVAAKNIIRIDNLPDPVCAFAFTAWRGYAMIALMITIGITLRNSEIPRYYLSVPYTAMGGVLLIGSTRFFRQFAVTTRRTNPS